MTTQFRLNDNFSIDQTHLIGKGSTGNVYLGLNNHNIKQKYAIKAIDLKEVNNQVTRYLLSCQIVALTNISKDDPKHIVKLLDVILSKDCCYLVMQLLEGGPLSQIIKQNPKGLQQGSAIQIFRQLIEGYKQIKRHGIVHRDIKPDNIIFRNKIILRPGQSLSPEHLNVAIIDFGYCTVQNIPNRPQVYYNVGSPKYMSPEAFKNNTYSQKSDIWALGIILYQMLHGKTFDTGMEMAEYLKCIQTNGIPIAPHISQDMRTLLNGMLSCDPRIRFNSQRVEEIIKKTNCGKTQKPKNISQNKVHSPQKRYFSQQKYFVETPTRPLKVNLMQSMIINTQNQNPQLQSQIISNQNPLYRRGQTFVRTIDVNHDRINGRKIVHLQGNSNKPHINAQLSNKFRKLDTVFQQEHYKNQIYQQNDLNQQQILSKDQFQKLAFRNSLYKSQLGQITERKTNIIEKQNIIFNSQIATVIRPSSPFTEPPESRKIIPFQVPNQGIYNGNPNLKQERNLQKSYSTNNCEMIMMQGQQNNSAQKNFILKQSAIFTQGNNQNQLFLRNTMPHFINQPKQNYRNAINTEQREQYLQNQTTVNRNKQNYYMVKNQNQLRHSNEGTLISHINAPLTVLRIPNRINSGTKVVKSGQQRQPNKFNININFLPNSGQNQQFRANNLVTIENINPQFYNRNAVINEGPIRTNYPGTNFEQANILNANGFQTVQRRINSNVNNKMAQINRNYFAPQMNSVFQQKLNMNPQPNYSSQNNVRPYQLQNQRLLINDPRRFNSFRQSVIIQQRNY